MTIKTNKKDKKLKDSLIDKLADDFIKQNQNEVNKLVDSCYNKKNKKKIIQNWLDSKIEVISVGSDNE